MNNVSQPAKYSHVFSVQGGETQSTWLRTRGDSGQRRRGRGKHERGVTTNWAAETHTHTSSPHNHLGITPTQNLLQISTAISYTHYLCINLTLHSKQRAHTHLHTHHSCSSYIKVLCGVNKQILTFHLAHLSRPSLQSSG